MYYLVRHFWIAFLGMPYRSATWGKGVEVIDFSLNGEVTLTLSLMCVETINVSAHTHVEQLLWTMC